MRGPRAFGSPPPMSSHHCNLEPLGRWHATVICITKVLNTSRWTHVHQWQVAFIILILITQYFEILSPMLFLVGFFFKFELVSELQNIEWNKVLMSSAANWKSPLLVPLEITKSVMDMEFLLHFNIQYEVEVNYIQCIKTKRPCLHFN